MIQTRYSLRMSRKLVFILSSVVMSTLASGQTKDLTNLIEKANRLKALDPSCPPGTEKAATIAESCQGLALFACDGGPIPESGKRNPQFYQKRYETALATYFSRSGPGSFRNAIKATGTGTSDCSLASACGKRVIAAMAQTLTGAQIYTPSDLTGTQPRTLNLDLESWSVLLNDETLLKLLQEAHS